MRKLVVKMSISVDGFVSGENDWIFKTGLPQLLITTYFSPSTPPCLSRPLLLLF